MGFQCDVTKFKVNKNFKIFTSIYVTSKTPLIDIDISIQDLRKSQIEIGFTVFELKTSKYLKIRYQFYVN